MVSNYDPKSITVIFGAKIITGFGDGTFVTVERNEQAFALKVGVDGEGTRAKSNNFSGKVTITLMQSSPSNDDLSASAIADQISNSGAEPLLVKDSLGTTLASAVTAWVQKFPNAEYSKEASTRSWVIETDELLLFVGGNSR